MKHVLFSNTLSRLRRALAQLGEPQIEYLAFTFDAQAGAILLFLRESPGRFRAAEPAGRSSGLQKKFVDFVAEINHGNRSRSWWALKFTDKNPCFTRLCERTSQLLQIVDVVESGGPETCAVISDDAILIEQFRRWARGKDVRVTDVTRIASDAREILKRICPVAPLAAFFRAVGRAICGRRLCRKALRAAGKVNVVLSLLTEGSITRDGHYRDTYFGDLITRLENEPDPLLNVLIVTGGRYAQVVRKARDASGAPPIATLESLIGPGGLTLALLTALKKYFAPVRIKGPTKIAGVDVRYLLEAELKADYRSGRYFDNLRVYHAVRRLGKRLAGGRFFYPFENRAFEKMLLLALRETARQTRTIGYQHASLSQRHTNVLLSAGERDILPLPDAIMTMGKVTRDFMIDPGGFPAELLHIGCALRQKPYDGPLKAQGPIRRLLVVLATNVEEYIKVIRFLNAAFGEQCPYELWLRPHPAFSLGDALAVTGPPRFAYYKSDSETLSECLDWADVVLYVHSTVSIEALAMGTPVVYLNVPNVLNPDPLLSFDEFRWRADLPQDLPPAIELINDLSGDEFVRRQELGVRFTREYFFPVDENSMEAFLSA